MVVVPPVTLVVKIFVPKVAISGLIRLLVLKPLPEVEIKALSSP